MISAREAKLKTAASIEQNTYMMINDIESQINETIDRGMSYIWVSIIRKVNVDKVAGTYRGLGFDVEVDFMNNNIKISWN